MNTRDKNQENKIHKLDAKLFSYFKFYISLHSGSSFKLNRRMYRFYRHCWICTQSLQLFHFYSPAYSLLLSACERRNMKGGMEWSPGQEPRVEEERDAAAPWWKEADRRNVPEEPSVGNWWNLQLHWERFSAKRASRRHCWYDLSGGALARRLDLARLQELSKFSRLLHDAWSPHAWTSRN